MGWDTIPPEATLKVTPFDAHASDQELADFHQLLRLSKIAPKTFENIQGGTYYYQGVSRQWMVSAKQRWETDYDWRKTEARINAVPNFITPISMYEDETIDIHFAALSSAKADAPALLLLHGWPGSFLELLGLMEKLKQKYTPTTLPFHVIVPSLPGYGYSSGPPLDRQFRVEDIARYMDALMVGLGFGSGYIAQGGDIGSFVARVLTATFDNCKTGHFNMCGMKPPSEYAVEALDERELEGHRRTVNFNKWHNAYAFKQATKPSIMGLVLSSSPLALLAWNAELFLASGDQNLPLDEVLDSVTLYWLTETYPRCIYPYRQFYEGRTIFHDEEEYHIKKPFGYSWYPRELVPTPMTWVATTGNLVWSRAHDAGGHFAAWERPDLFLKDMEDFVAEVWPLVNTV